MSTEIMNKPVKKYRFKSLKTVDTVKCDEREPSQVATISHSTHGSDFQESDQKCTDVKKTVQSTLAVQNTNKQVQKSLNYHTTTLLDYWKHQNSDEVIGNIGTAVMYCDGVATVGIGGGDIGTGYGIAVHTTVATCGTANGTGDIVGTTGYDRVGVDGVTDAIGCGMFCVGATDGAINAGACDKSTISAMEKMHLNDKNPNGQDIVECGQHKMAYVFFDLETTGLACDADIVQISCICGHQRFNRYILPAKSIRKGASQITGIKKYKGKMYVNRCRVKTVSLTEGLHDFITYLRRWQKSVTLLAHNAWAFDARVLYNALSRAQVIDEFISLHVTFLDTLTLFRKTYSTLDCHKQEYLARQLLGKEYSAHNALEDVTILQELFYKCPATETVLQQHVFTVTQVQKLLMLKDLKSRNLSTLHVLVKTNCISQAMAEKIAVADINYLMLLEGYKRTGKNGIMGLLIGEDSFKPKVTKCKRIIDDIENYFVNNLS